MLNSIKTKYWLSVIAVAAVLVSGSMSVSPVVFADDDDEDDDDNGQPKTLESECAKKLKKKNLNLDGLFCQAIFGLQELFAGLQATIDEHIAADSDLDPENELQDWSTLPGIPDDIADGDNDTLYDGTDFALSNQACDNVGDVVTGFDENGNVLCKEDEAGSGDTTELQNQVDDLTGQLSTLKNNLDIADDCTVRGPGVDLHGCGLSSVDFGGADLSGANLSFSDLRLADFTGSTDLSNADLSFSDLRGADLTSSNLERANFRLADLRSADLSFSNLERALFSGANLVGNNLEGTDLRNADLTGADLSFASTLNADLRNAEFILANLEGVNFSGANLDGAIFGLLAADDNDAFNQPTGNINCIGTPIAAQFTCTG